MKPAVIQTVEQTQSALFSALAKHHAGSAYGRRLEQWAIHGMPEKPPVQRDQPKPAPLSKPNGSAAPGPRQPAPVTDLPGWVDEEIPSSAYGDA